MRRKKEYEVCNRIIQILRNKGFIINRYYARTTKSIYIKIDYGMCGAIRISDHKGKIKYRYKFNLINGYIGPKRIIDRGYVRLFYDYDDIDTLIKDIENEKEKKLSDLGIKKYEYYMKINSKKDLYKSFKNVA